MTDTSNKIEPFRGHFENLQAMLARIAEDDQAVGFISCVKYKDGSLWPVTFNATNGDLALTSIILARQATEG